jgi:hypothetical protein
MSDYGDPHDPTYGHEPADHTRFLGLIAGLACLVIILGLGLALGVGYGPPTHVASHDAAPPQQTTLPAIPFHDTRFGPAAVASSQSALARPHEFSEQAFREERDGPA